MTLDEFKKLTEAATPGPWECTGEEYSACVRECDTHGTVAAFVACYPEGPMSLDIDDARFIAACRDMVPKLIAVAEASSWISQLDMDPEDHKSYRKFDRLQQALSALNQSAAIIPAK